MNEARQAIAADPDIGAQNILVVWGKGWHRGVIGIVASKLVDQYCRPAIVLSVDGEVAHGSGRSIPGFNLLGALEHCHDLFERFGGHHQAAGLTLETPRLQEFRTRITEYANETLGPDDLVPRLGVDAQLSLNAIVVDQSDVQQVLANLGRCDGCPEDVNGDGVVNGSDVQAVARYCGLPRQRQSMNRPRASRSPFPRVPV